MTATNQVNSMRVDMAKLFLLGGSRWISFAWYRYVYIYNM